MVRSAPRIGRDEGRAHGPDAQGRNQLVDLGGEHLASAATKTRSTSKPPDKPEHVFEHELMETAEQLIVKGKEQGYLTPDDILQGFPEIDAEPDQIFRIFAAFKEIGIEVTDGEKDFEEVEQIDDEMLLDIEMMDSVSLDDPVRMYLKEIGRVSLLTAN